MDGWTENIYSIFRDKLLLLGELGYTESAYGASSDSGSSEEKRKSREREHKQTKKATAREKKKKEKAKDVEPKKNTCPHCKKYHRKKPHRVEPQFSRKRVSTYSKKKTCSSHARANPSSSA